MPGDSGIGPDQGIPLVDHHVHGVVTAELDRAAFELLVSESGVPAPQGTTHFDTPVGLSVRRWCAPLLDLAPHAAADEYLLRRAELGADAVNRRFLSAAGVSTMLVDTGHRPADVASPERMAALSGAPALEVLRIETLGESVARRVAAGDLDAAGWSAAVGEALAQGARTAAGFKTVVAYRHGFDLPVDRPRPSAVSQALDAWLRERAPDAPLRLEAPVLLAEVLHQALEVARDAAFPVQVHAGFGDTELDLHRADPVVFTPWVRRAAALGVPLVFLHCYPYHRQAGYLAEAFANVYFDVGCILNYAGPSARRVLAEALELAPFTKMLYSSDAFGLAELFYLSALQFRRHVSGILTAFVDAGECSGADAERYIHMIGTENARRIYPMDRARVHHPGAAAPAGAPPQL